MSETTLRLDRPLKMVTICLGQMQTNCYIVENTKTNQAFVFDPGDQGEHIMDTLKEDGMELAGVCLTHGHFDHVMALPYLMEQKPDLNVYLFNFIFRLMFFLKTFNKSCINISFDEIFIIDDLILIIDICLHAFYHKFS